MVRSQTVFCSLLLFLSLLVSLGVVLLQRNLPLYFSLSFPSIVHSRRLSPHHLITVSLSFSRLCFPPEVAFLLGRDVPPLLHFSKPRCGIILDGTVDNVYGT